MKYIIVVFDILVMVLSQPKRLTIWVFNFEGLNFRLLAIHKKVNWITSLHKVYNFLKFGTHKFL